MSVLGSCGVGSGEASGRSRQPLQQLFCTSLGHVLPVTSCLMTHAPCTLPICAGVFATAAAGALLLPSLLQLALIGGGLWLGATVSQAYFGGGGGSSIDPDSTIDVEAESVDDDWRNEMFKCGHEATGGMARGTLQVVEAMRYTLASHMSAPVRFNERILSRNVQGEARAGAGAARF